MQSRIQIFTDEKGKKTSVIVPYEDWEKMKARLENLQNKLKIASSVRNGIREIEEARKKGREFQTLTDFIDENRS